MNKTCRTCKSSHVKADEFPCRGCQDYERWEFAAKDPWPMFPLKPDPWLLTAPGAQDGEVGRG